MSLALCAPTDQVWDEPVAQSVGVDESDRQTLVGAGAELKELVRKCAELAADALFPASRQTETVAEKFARFSERWRAETGYMSSASEMAMHPSYQGIIGLGKEAIPLILKELSQAPDHWFWALRAITDTDPVPPCDRGNLPKMAEAWVRWGRSQRYEVP